MNLKENLLKGFLRENPVFIMALGLCPTLAVSSSLSNSLGMGLASTAVLLGSNTIISLIKNWIPAKVRIPCYIVVIASFVSVIDMVMHAFLPALHKSLGLFIPLIVVNCLILGRAEAFASKNGVFESLIDAVSMGLGFTFALSVLGVIRELLGAGKILGFQIMPDAYQPMLVAILAPGAFITLGFIMGFINLMQKKEQ